jgi:hypothetical protein
MCIMYMMPGPSSDGEFNTQQLQCSKQPLGGGPVRDKNRLPSQGETQCGMW